MLAWVVMNRQHLPRAARGSRQSFLPPRSDSHFGSHPTPIPAKIVPFFSCTYVQPILQPLCFQIHACNGGCTPSGSRVPIPCSLSPACPQGKPRDPLYFHILAHSSAFFCTRAKLNSFLFNRFRTLWQKHRGWGRGEPLCCQKIRLRMQPPQHQARKKKWDRHESLSHKS
jgi:hypothetical protein